LTFGKIHQDSLATLNHYYTMNLKVIAPKLYLIGTFILASACARAEQEGDYTYTIAGNAVAITKYTGKNGEAKIPSTINKLPVKDIGANAFLGSKGLTSVMIPEGVISIGDIAFGDCEKLAKVAIPASVTSIGNYVFRGCPKLLSIVVAPGNPNYCSIDGVCFDKLQTTLLKYPGGKKGAYVIPDSVTSVRGAFAYCEGLEGLVMGKGLTAVDARAFAGCKNLASVTVGNNVTSIGGSAFVMCESLAAVTLGSGVTSIGGTAFQDCNKLAAVIIPDNVVSIDGGAFAGCTALKSVTIGRGVSSVGASAFGTCPNLARATFTGNAPAVGSNIFEGAASSFSIHYGKGSTGFTSPTWNGYPATQTESP
jgi:BspA type Leucine rich repeat region (6 copies)